MKVLQSVLALLLVLVLGCAITPSVFAATIEESASGDLIATLERKPCSGFAAAGRVARDCR